jgi:hypothetical protein
MEETTAGAEATAAAARSPSMPPADESIPRQGYSTAADDFPRLRLEFQEKPVHGEFNFYPQDLDLC